MFRKELINIYKENGFDLYEASSEVDLAIEMIAGLNPKEMLLGACISDENKEKISNIVKERVKTRRPIQQLLGQAFFMGEKFAVNEYTLIPRPETEILVLETLKLIKDDADFKILDIGSGSGCIPVMIAKNTESARIESVDICSKALETARLNSESFSVQSRVDFYLSDLFEKVTGKFNIIVSNPPYIPISEKDCLQSEVRDFEPSNALFASDEKGIDIYKKIIEKSKDYIILGGHILFELGINQSDLVKDIFIKNEFSEIKIIKDLDGIDRVIIARYGV